VHAIVIRSDDVGVMAMGRRFSEKEQSVGQKTNRERDCLGMTRILVARKQAAGNLGGFSKRRAAGHDITHG
jgi:hypothetical protein